LKRKHEGMAQPLVLLNIMMRNLFHILPITFFLFSSLSFSQTIEWGIKIGGSYEDVAFDIVKDSSGNTYVTGGFSNSVNFNPNGSPYLINAIGVNSSDAYIAKYNKYFDLLWAFSLGTSSWEKGAKLLVDDSLNVYLIGEGFGNIDFDPSIGTNFFDCSPTNAFIAKYNKDGVFKAVNRISSISMYPPNSNVFFDNQNNIFTYSNDTLSKFNFNLQLIWKKSIGGNPELFNKSEFYSIKNFKTPFYSINTDQNNLFLEKYDNITGNLTYSKQCALANGFISGGFIKKTKNDKLIVSGKFWGTVSFYGNNDTVSVSNSDMGYNPWGQYPLEREFIALYDTLENILWVKAYDGTSPEPYIIETDNDGYIYTLGFINFDANFDPDHSVIINNGGYGNYIAKYDSNFTYCAVSQFLGGSYNDFIGGFKLYNDTAVMCGHFFNTIDLDLSASNFSLFSSPPEDIFVARYSNFDIVTNPALVPENTKSFPVIRVYPNPSNGFFELEINSLSENTIIEVYDIKGNVLLSKKTIESIERIDLSNYPSSIYILSMKTETSIVTKRIIKINKR